MTTIRYRKIDLTLDGDLLSGNMFAVKDFIKSKLNGQWDSARKLWIVDLEQVNYWIAQHAITVHNDVTTPTTTKAAYNGCPKCHTYCYGDCTS
jgi:hypothetical protein